MSIQHVDEQSFRQLIESEKLVLVDFWAPWCEPCKLIAPVLEELSAEIGDKADIVKLNVDDHPSIAAEMKINGIPTLKLFRRGNILRTMVGLQAKQGLKELIELYL